MRPRHRLPPSLSAVLALLVALPAAAQIASFDSGNLRRVKFSKGSTYVVVEVLRDDLLHFEVSAVAPVAAPERGIYTSPMIVPATYAGPKAYALSGNVLETAALRVQVMMDNLCVVVWDKKSGVQLNTICPRNLQQPWKGLSIERKSMRHVYGLGNYFADPSTADGDWVGRVWQDEPSGHGNFRRAFHGAAPSTAQFPVMYALGDGMLGYALFLDHPYKLRWDFTGSWWNVDTWGDQLRFYLIAGASLPAMRTTYLGLVGTPLVPPKRSFGFFQSKFGYQSWNDLYGELRHLRQNAFPIDGFSLDIQWFGKDFGGDPKQSPMGALTFDPNRFPSPADAVRALKEKEGVSLMTIEESVVSAAVPAHKQLADRGFLARAGCASCAPSYLAGNPWWGLGGYIDWTNAGAGDFWHDLKRQPLVAMGITSHWTDLGEPETQLYDPNGFYAGWPAIQKFGHGDVHNLYAFKWLESIARGYARNNVAQRPFMLSRAGAPGIWRFGAAMWSGDIARNMGSLKAQLNTQMHMALAGQDYYGSDAGGFTVPSFGLDAGGDRNELYTQWFASSALLDIPLRPHGWVGGEYQSFAPDLNGHPDSNRDNLRQRYELSPYVYSLAHRAYRFGEPVFPPVVYYFQDDLSARGQANLKMIGPSLLFAIVAGYGETDRRVYLPRGRWANWHSHEWTTSTGAYSAPWPLYREGLFKLPLFARAGAIIPKMYVDEKTMNVSGRRTDGTTRAELVLRVYADPTTTTFSLFEDDGETVAYRRGAVRETKLSQQLKSGYASVRIAPAAGTYAGAPSTRDNVVELVVERAVARSTTFNGRALPPCASAADFASGKVCVHQPAAGLVVARTGPRAISEDKTLLFALAAAQPTTSLALTCADGATNPGEAIFAVGNVAQLGGWQAQRALRLIPIRYPKWGRTLAGLPANTRVEWKCIRRAEAGGNALGMQSGANNVATTPAAGFAGTSAGTLR